MLYRVAEIRNAMFGQFDERPSPVSTWAKRWYRVASHSIKEVSAMWTWHRADQDLSREQQAEPSGLSLAETANRRIGLLFIDPTKRTLPARCTGVAGVPGLVKSPACHVGLILIICKYLSASTVSRRPAFVSATRRSPNRSMSTTQGPQKRSCRRANDSGRPAPITARS
jgi:hypothetical protein